MSLTSEKGQARQRVVNMYMYHNLIPGGKLQSVQKMKSPFNLGEYTFIGTAHRELHTQLAVTAIVCVENEHRIHFFFLHICRGGKKFSDTLKLLPNPNYCHSIFACVSLRGKKFRLHQRDIVLFIVDTTK